MWALRAASISSKESTGNSARSAPVATIFAMRLSPASSAISLQGTETQVISLRATSRSTIEELTISTPPGLTIDSYLSRDGRFIMMVAGGFWTKGEPISSSAMTTVQLAVPVSYTHLRAHETRHDLVCRLLLE